MILHIVTHILLDTVPQVVTNTHKHMGTWVPHTYAYTLRHFSNGPSTDYTDRVWRTGTTSMGIIDSTEWLSVFDLKTQGSHLQVSLLKPPSVFKMQTLGPAWLWLGRSGQGLAFLNLHLTARSVRADLKPPGSKDDSCLLRSNRSPYIFSIEPMRP